jgi:Protein of unknown function (DUF4239)
MEGVCFVVFKSILAAALAILVVVVAAHLFHRSGKGKVDDDPDGVTAGHAGAMLSALFLLVFAIAVIVPWSDADSARQNTYAESNALTEAYWTAGGLPAAQGAAIRTGLRDYTSFVANKEWAVMGHGRLSNTGWAKLDTLRQNVSTMQFADKNDQDTQSAVLDQLTNVFQARRQRVSDAKTSLPSAVLFFTVLTGLVMIFFPLLAGARPRGMTLIPLVVMSGLLGISLYMVFNIDHTFSGDLRVKPDAFRSALQEYQRIP